METHRIVIPTTFLTKSKENTSIIIDNKLESLLVEIPKNAKIFIERNSYIEIKDYLGSLFNDYDYFIWDQDKSTLLEVSDICKSFVDLKVKKSDKVIIIGNKFFIDIFGFACSIYLNGLETYLIPTTLLAMTDSTGGHYLLNSTKFTKRDIEIVTHPIKILIHPPLSKLSSNKNFCSGLANILKYSLINSLPLFKKLHNCIHFDFDKRKISDDILFDIIDDTIKAKIDIIAFSDNHKSKNYESYTEFGNTFAKLIEIIAGNSITFGEALSFGLEITIKLSLLKNKNVLSDNQMANFKSIIRAINPSIDKKLSVSKNERLINIINNEFDNIFEVLLLTNIGETPSMIKIEKSKLINILKNWEPFIY